MNILRLLLGTMAVTCLLGYVTGCKDSPNDAKLDPLPVSSGALCWDVDIDNGNGNMIVLLNNDGSLDGYGELTMNWQGKPVTCSWHEASGTWTETSVSFTAPGEAYYSGAPNGYRNSNFVVSLNATSRGANYTVTFSQTGWPSNIKGTTSGTTNACDSSTITK